MKLLLTFIGLCLVSLKFCSATNSSDNGPSVALTRQAVEMGMEPSVLGELWRNKQPIVISKPNSAGQLITTTYELSPDGQRILSSTVSEADQPAPKVEVTTSTARPVSPQTDWEYLPSSIGHRRVFTTTPIVNNWPNFGDGFPQWSTGRNTPNWPSFEFPAGVTPQTSTKTEQDGQGRTVTTTIKTYRSPGFNGVSGINWPRFEFPTGVTPEVSTKTELDDQGRTVTTTTKTYKGPVTSSNWSPEGQPSSWQPRPNIFEAQRPSWLDRPVFSVGNTATNPNLIPKEANPVPTPLPLPSRPTVQAPLPTRPTLPVFGQTTPRTIATINFDDLPAYQTTNELPTNTRVTSYSGVYNSAAPPKTADLAPPIRDMLSNAGITDDDILTAHTTGSDIVRNKVTPDGRVIKTTFRVNTQVAASPEAALPTAPPTPPTPQPPAVVHYQPQPAVERRHESALPNQQQDKSIEDFLSQVNLKPSDILAQNGEVVKTIIDKDGRVLSAKFVLSSVKGDEETRGQGQAEPPTK